jgi:hypothetical protein
MQAADSVSAPSTSPSYACFSSSTSDGVNNPSSDHLAMMPLSNSTKRRLPPHDNIHHATTGAGFDSKDTGGRASVTMNQVMITKDWIVNMLSEKYESNDAPSLHSVQAGSFAPPTSGIRYELAIQFNVAPSK